MPQHRSPSAPIPASRLVGPTKRTPRHAAPVQTRWSVARRRASNLLLTALGSGGLLAALITVASGGVTP